MKSKIIPSVHRGGGSGHEHTQSNSKIVSKLQLPVLLLFTLSCFAQEFKSPTDYLSFINNEQTAISKSTWKYTSAVAHSKSARKIDATRKQLIKSIQSSKKKIGALQNGYKGDTEYQNQVIQYFDFCENNLNEEYDKIIDMQEVSQQSYDFMEAYILMRDLINDKLDSEGEKAANAFKSFALKYNIRLAEGDSDLSKKIRLSNEVFDYHTALYLIFFKANFTDISLAKAIESKELGAIQQNANTLLQYADEGLEKLKSIKPYNGDASVLNATKKALEYYKREAVEYVPKVTAFYMFSDKFENAKKSIESKSAKDRSKEEIENFNSMVKQINKEIDGFNKINNANFQEKKTFVEGWNTIGDNFISKQVPND